MSREPASAPLPISANETKGRCSFLRPPVLFIAFHLPHPRNALITPSIIAVKTFGDSLDAHSVHGLYVHTLRGASCHASTAFSSTPARTKAVSACVSSCIQRSACSFSAASFCSSTNLQTSFSAASLLSCNSLCLSRVVGIRVKSPNIIFSVKMENKMKSSAAPLKSCLQLRLIASLTGIL